MSLHYRLTSLTRTFRRELRVYQLVLKDARVPRPAKWLIGLAVAYAVSPIDVIPDFIPVIGHLDDLLIVPSLIFFAMKMVPVEVLQDCRQKAREQFR